MPTNHRRIGLVVDEPVDRVMDLYRDQAKPALRDAAIARHLVLSGSLVEAMVKLAHGDTTEHERAAEIVARLKELVPDLQLPNEVKTQLLETLSRTSERRSLAERRSRQFALIRGAGRPDGQTAQDLAETFDAFERVPAR